MRGAFAVLVVAAGCGRLGFDPYGTADGSLRDVSAGEGDTPSGDGPGAVACSPAFDLCDDFEAESLDTSLWTADAMVTLDTTRAHRGGQSVHVHMPAFAPDTGHYQTLAETQTIMTSTTFWVRAWFWLSALPAAGNGLELMTAERPGSAGDYVFVFSDSTHVYSQYDLSSRISATTVPTGSWFCVVWKVVRSTSASGSLETSGDVPALALTNIQTDSSSSPMTVLTLGLGFASSNTPSAQPALDLWIDDVIAHSAPVTCAD
jgi:hypothetical protein